MSAHAAKAIEVSPERIALDAIEVNEELGYKIHPFADAFPMMKGADFDELVEDIRKNGLREPVEYIEHNGERIIVDGRNRLKACIAAGVEPWFDMYPHTETDETILAYVWSKNVHRRQLTASQRSMIATEHQAFIDAIAKSSAQRRKATQGRPKKGAKKTERKVALSRKTAAVVAKPAKVSTRTMEHAMAVKKSGDVKLISEVKQGKKSVSAAAKELRAKKAPTKTTKPAAAKKAAPAKKTATAKKAPAKTDKPTPAKTTKEVPDGKSAPRATKRRRNDAASPEATADRMLAKHSNEWCLRLAKHIEKKVLEDSKPKQSAEREVNHGKEDC